MSKKNPCITFEPREWKVWKTITLGTHKDADELIGAMKADGLDVSDWFKDKPTFTVATERTDIQLVKVTVAELGFLQGAKRRDIYARAAHLGLSLVPAEVGPQLRRQYKDQPGGEWICIGMKPIFDWDGFLFIFRVEREFAELWLRTFYGFPLDSFSGSLEWVFTILHK